MMDPIEQYLIEQSSAGLKHSAGAFTISAEKALAKLASFQLPRPSSWLLKMVQAGVAAGASKIAVSQTAKSTRITYDGGLLGTLEDLVALATDPQALVTPAQQHLLIGLRSVALAHQRPVLMLEEPADRPASTAFWQGTQVSAPEPETGRFQHFKRRPEEGCLTFHVGESPKPELVGKKRSHGLNRVCADEYRDLTAHAVVCPIPLAIDLRRLDHFGLDDASFHRCPLLFGAQAAKPGELGLALSPTVRLEEDCDAVTLYRAAWTVYLTDAPRPSEVCWVRDGVICESSALPSMNAPFFLRLYLSAQHLETDLTGLQLRFPDNDQRRRWIWEGLQAFAASAPAISSTKPLPFRSKHTPGRSASWWGATALMVGGVMLLPVTPGGAVMSLAGLARLTAANRQGQQEYEEEMRVRLPRWAQVMAQTRPA
jgi:hypothetical protein